MLNFALIISSIVIGAAGQILLKIGVNKLGGFNINASGVRSMLKSYYILTGLLLFGISFLLWVKVLTKNDLSYVYPMMSLSYIIILIASRFLFNEPITVNKVIGISAIITGVYLLHR